MKKIIIIGAGITGLSSAWKLSEKGYNVNVIESDKTIGGLAKSIKIENYYFDIGPHSFFSEDKEVFTAWTFWAGAFEKNEGWKAVKNGWVGIFKLHAGEMSVQVSRLEIDSRARNAIVYGKYKWGNQNGDLIAAFQNQKGKWLIRAIDFTNERFGKQIPKLAKPAYRNPKDPPA